PLELADSYLTQIGAQARREVAALQHLLNLPVLFRVAGAQMFDRVFFQHGDRQTVFEQDAVAAQMGDAFFRQQRTEQVQRVGGVDDEALRNVWQVAVLLILPLLLLAAQRSDGVGQRELFPADAGNEATSAN